MTTPEPEVPKWFTKLHVRYCLRRGQYVPPEYLTPYWVGKHWAKRLGMEPPR